VPWPSRYAPTSIRKRFLRLPTAPEKISFDLVADRKSGKTSAGNLQAI
jgi:hypothetical protein